jgi:hypothetical protein
LGFPAAARSGPAGLGRQALRRSGREPETRGKEAENGEKKVKNKFDIDWKNGDNASRFELRKWASLTKV